MDVMLEEYENHGPAVCLSIRSKQAPGCGHKQSLFGCKRKTMWCCADIKLPQSIMVIITPFIKIGQLSKHLASIVRLKSVGFWLSECPTYFPRFSFFYQGLLFVI